jgi:hypothetical protein
MAKRKFTKQQVIDGLKSLELLMKDAHNEAANKELDTMVAGYNRMVHKMGMAHDLMVLPG